MNIFEKFSSALRKRPVEIIEFIIGAMWIIAGVIAVLHPTEQTMPALGVLTTSSAIRTYSAWLVLTGTLDVIALLTLKWPLRQKVRRLATFLFFITFLFFLTIRLLVFGWTEVIWLTLLSLALISGVLHIKLRLDD